VALVAPLDPPRLIAIVGPTASGKSALALRLAAENGGEIVSCDSMQVYRGLDIGTAKPTAEERRLVPHHLLDVVEPDQPVSAADYARLGRAALAAIRDRGRLPVVAGGTGLYLKALLHGLFAGPSRDPAFRARLEAFAARRGDARLHRLLARLDPDSAARIPPADRVRIVRALEVLRATGRRIGEHHQAGLGDGPLRGFTPAVFGIDPDRALLRNAVERRTREMFERGLLAEVERLLARGFSPTLRPLQAIGYRQAVAVLQRHATVEQAQRDIVTETMRYAKRQMTWFRHQARVAWSRTADEAHAAATAWLVSAVA
jgi:tRNA dimethylallyltransferase